MATYCPCVPDPHDLDDAIRMCSSSRTLTVTLTATVTGCMGGSKDKCTHAYSHGYPVPTHMEEEDGEEYDNGDEDEHKEIPGGEGGEEECDGSDEDEYNEVSEGEEVEEYYNCDEDEYKDIPEEMEGEGEEEEEKQEKEELNDSEGSCIPPSPTLKPTSSDLVDYDNEKCRGGCQTGVPQVTFSHEYSIKSPPNLSTPTSKLTRSKTITITYTVTDSTTHPSFSEDKSSTVNSPDSDPSNTHKIGHSSTTSTSWATQGSPTYTGSASRFVHAPRKVTGQLGILMGCIWVGFVVVGRVQRDVPSYLPAASSVGKLSFIPLLSGLTLKVLFLFIGFGLGFMLLIV